MNGGFQRIGKLIQIILVIQCFDLRGAHRGIPLNSRLILRHYDLSGHGDATALTRASPLVIQAFNDGWLPNSGLAYTTRQDDNVDIADRYWWPMTEAIGVFADLQKLYKNPEFESLYRQTSAFAHSRLIYHVNGGWFRELDISGQPLSKQFLGKPDIYHSVQATLFPLVPKFVAA